MRPNRFLFCLGLCIGFVLPSVLIAADEDPDALAKEGKAQLWASQDDPKAIVAAAQLFAKAALLYEKSGQTEAAVETNSYLYWCKKKMTNADMDLFLKGKDGDTAKLMEQIGKEALSQDQGAKWLERAEKFAATYPDEHLLIAIRFYEVADRFKGTDVSLKAQDRSLTAMQQAMKSKPAPVAAAPVMPVEAPKPEKAPMSDVVRKLGDLQQGRSTDRFPEPSAEEQKKTEALVRDIFKEEFAKTGPEEKLNLAVVLLRKAGENEADLTTYFVLKKLMVLLHAESGRWNWVPGGLDDLEKVFEVRNPAEFRRVVYTAAAGGTKEPATLKRIQAFKGLLDKPDDPALNLIVARQYLSESVQVERVLPFAEKSGDAALVAVIKDFIAKKGDWGALVEPGDAWWDMAEKETDNSVKMAYYNQARSCYALAAPKLTGLAKLKAEKRGSDIAEMERKTKDETRSVSAPMASRPNSPANSGGASQTNAGKAPKLSGTTPGLIKGEELMDHLTFVKANVPYKIGRTLSCSRQVNGGVDITAEPGVEIIGGVIQLDNGGKMVLEGTPDKPIILRNIVIRQNLGAKVVARNVIFDKCKFEKMHGSFNYYSSKWTFNNCVLYKSNFDKFWAVDFGFQLEDCAMVDCNMPEIDHNRGENFDHARVFRSEWNKLRKCLFLDCQVSGTVFWCSEDSNFLNCKFLPGMAFDSEQEWVVNAYVFNPIGAIPKASKRKQVTISTAPKPLPLPELPEKCPVVELGARQRILYPPKR